LGRAKTSEIGAISSPVERGEDDHRAHEEQDGGDGEGDR